MLRSPVRSYQAGHNVAVKTLLQTLDPAGKAAFVEEAKIMTTLTERQVHPNVLSLIGVVQSEFDLALVTEYCRYGDLHTFLATAQTQGIQLDLVDLCKVVEGEGEGRGEGEGMRFGGVPFIQLHSLEHASDGAGAGTRPRVS